MCDVILVDDERIELEALKKLINKLGIKVNIVGELQSAKEAIAAHKDFKADVIIIDNEMPGINGTELAKIIKSNNKDKIIILLIEYYNFNHYCLNID
ncbi:response regulator [Clostridium butyricum]